MSVECCIACAQPMHQRGGPAQLHISLDMGDDYTGGGSDGRVRMCGTCATERVNEVLGLVAKQFQANAEAQKAAGPR